MYKLTRVKGHKPLDAFKFDGDSVEGVYEELPKEGHTFRFFTMRGDELVRIRTSGVTFTTNVSDDTIEFITQKGSVYRLETI